MALRFVLDTDVVVAAMRSKHGASQRILRAALDGEFAMLVSVPLLLEYEAVLTRPEHLLFCGLTEKEVRQAIDNIVVIAEPVWVAFSWRPQLRDPDDDMVLETAVNGRANAVVTFNQKDFAGMQAGFGCDAIRPAEALTRIRSSWT